ncbi:HlyD family efflux transporter periplasmic adaptor subunit [Candidatus Uhrbacteria bacterium]|nr:HlyD family efflux transporter periplasmic adaptor subunit [Candidatus Uhrbacteria bacterium]
MNEIRTSFFSRHKTGIIVLILILIGIGGGGYFAYRQSMKPKSETRSILGTVEKGTLTTTVSGSGQISLSNQIDVKPKVSGDIIVLNGKSGDEIKEGTVIANIDSREASKAVRDARDNLESSLLSLQKLMAPADRLALLQAQHSLDAAKEAQAQADKDLETARLNLDKLKSPPDPLSVIQAKNGVASAKEARNKADENLAKAYDDGFGVVVSAFLDMPGLLSNMDDMFFQSGIEKNQLTIDWFANQVSKWDYAKTTTYQQHLTRSYDTARAQYDTALALYKTATRASDYATLDKLIAQTATAVADLDTSIKSGKNFLDYVKDQILLHGTTVPSILTTDRNALDIYIGKSNTAVANMANAKRSINDAVGAVPGADRTMTERAEALSKLMNGPDSLDVRSSELTVQQKEQAIIDARRSVEEKTASLDKLKQGPDPLDVQSQELAILQKKNALSDAREKLLDYTLVAPFDGIVAKSDVQKGDAVSPGTVIATLITKQRIAEITLNEVDVSKVAVRQKAVLTLDALPDVSITGEVAEIDTIGTESQGVVSYIVTIIFDTQESRVKPGMSVSANIITAVHQDVLFVPNTAIKSRSTAQYVEAPAENDPQARIVSGGAILSLPTRRVQVEIGISNDESTEVVSGLKEGDLIVVNSLNVQAAGTSSQAPSSSAIRIPGLPGGGGGGFGGRNGGGAGGR